MKISPNVQKLVFVVVIVLGVIVLVLYALIWPDKVGTDLY
jgi:hypothetical protein